MSFDATLRLDPFIGRSFGAYRLSERIPDVRVGAAFVAEHRHLDRGAVVKLFQPAPPGVPGGGLPSVEARLRALSRARHEGVLPLVDVGEGDDGLVFVALELDEEVPLATLAARGQACLPWRQARIAGRQIAAAMRWAAAQGVAPTDLAPSQIFVASGGGGREPRARIELVTAEALGLSAPPPRAEADHVLAVGRALYLLLTGRSAAAGGSDAPPAPALSWPELKIPADADALVMRALAPEVNQRWPDLASLHRALGGLDAEVAGVTSSGSPADAWFASVEPAAPAAGGVVVNEGGRADAAFDDRDFDRFGGPGADFSGDFPPGVDGDSDFDSAEGSFGRKSFFVRPSRRALISGGVAGAAGLALLAIVVGTRPKVTERESAPSQPAIAQAPGAPGGPAAADQGAGGDGAIEAPGRGAVGGALGGAPASEVVATGPGSAAGAGAKAAASAAPVATTEVPAGPPPPPPPNQATAAPSSPPIPPTPGALAPPGAPLVPAPPRLDVQQVSPPDGQPLARTGTSSAESPGSAASDVARAPGRAAGEGAPGLAQPAGAASASALAETPGTEGAPGSPAGRCALSLGSRPGADIWIDGRRAGSSPLNDLPIACGTHDVAFTSTELGVERRLSVTVRPGETVKRVVDLEAPAPPLPVGAVGGPPPPGPVAGRAARSECHLSLGSRPWAEVWIDGRRVGVTPLVSLPVRCGKHDLLFLSREANVERRETIVVPEGQSVKKVVTLVEGE